MDRKTIIGKDVIESLTTSMYDDPRFVYREYIQNSADAIDKARQLKIVEDGNIYISIDSSKKQIIIEDDAIGIEHQKVAEILKNIAQSTKEKGVDKGFRGIGRLGGLGYCDKLIFETSSKGEEVKTIMIWDAKKLKEIINNRTQKEEASAVIDEVTTLKQEVEDIEKHYFKVILENVTNNNLLDVKDVRQYLSMVAPVPFKKSIFAEKIYKELENENITLDEYSICVNTEQLFKGYNWYVYEGADITTKKKIGEVIDIVFFKETNNQNDILLWGWYGITEKNQSLQQINHARGFRLRCSNIQIGDEYTLVKLQRDRRFQFYFFGEIYAIHKDLTPNARRDNFSENEIYLEFESKLKNLFHNEIYRLCYDASKVNSDVKNIQTYNTIKIEYEQKEKVGFIDKKEQEKLLENLKKKEDEATKSIERLEKLKTQNDTQNSAITKIIEKATSNIETEIEILEVPEIEPKKPTFRADKLSKLNKNDRKFLGEIFTIINNVLSKELAENLIQKIEEEYK